jgi:hypothetical protein
MSIGRHLERGSLMNNAAPDKRSPGWKAALLGALPKDTYSLVASIGVLAGIGYYIHAQNPWLLLTFIGLLFGKNVVDHVHPQR